MAHCFKEVSVAEFITVRFQQKWSINIFWDTEVSVAEFITVRFQRNTLRNMAKFLRVSVAEFITVRFQHCSALRYASVTTCFSS